MIICQLIKLKILGDYFLLKVESCFTFILPLPHLFIYLRPIILNLQIRSNNHLNSGIIDYN
ncbi:hypothetical protein BpHYR1_038832 [Brachionus plicatilis]|uniref:Uncharacterized protein n=1 Tax=Brachionus plicatilis TaxID=10195 RepID=A0A3M7SA86_BRAPC|nr:hypothetical protein BpHYR1_038832 [Brachionus plicatilis]